MSITGHAISQWLPRPVPSWVPSTIGTWGGNSVKFSLKKIAFTKVARNKISKKCTEGHF